MGDFDLAPECMKMSRGAQGNGRTESLGLETGTGEGGVGIVETLDLLSSISYWTNLTFFSQCPIHGWMDVILFMFPVA